MADFLLTLINIKPRCVNLYCVRAEICLLQKLYMKKIFVAIAVCMIGQWGFAQLREGKILYQRKVNMHKRLTGEQESMKNMVPEFTTFKLELLFSETESIFKQIEEEEDIRDQVGGPQEGRIIVRMGAGNETYKNYSAGKVIELRELGPKKYIIEDSFHIQPWKLDETESKTIKGYNCKKATTKNLQGFDVIAWYTDQIRCPSGPELYGGLPGMILELNIGDGEIVYSPLEIVTNADQKLVKAPTNGKKITRKEFQKMMDE